MRGVDQNGKIKDSTILSIRYNTQLFLTYSVSWCDGLAIVYVVYSSVGEKHEQNKQNLKLVIQYSTFQKHFGLTV